MKAPGQSLQIHDRVLSGLRAIDTVRQPIRAISENIIRTMPPSRLLRYVTWAFPKADVVLRLAKIEIDKAYQQLDKEDKKIVDHSLHYAERGDFLRATISFLSGWAKAGRHPSTLHWEILENYSTDYDKFKEGVMGFFMVQSNL